MRILGLGLAGVCCAASIAVADPADDRRHEGEELAKAGRYSEAIVAFKDANRVKPRASSACLIGLAYTRLERWPQAEIMIDRCKREASAADPTPDWLPALEQTLATRLQTAGVAPVTIAVAPADAKVQLTVSSFAPDETFEPRTIHLPPGTHVVVATAPGFAKAQATVEVGDVKPRQITIELKREGEATPPTAPVTPPPHDDAHPIPPPPPPAGGGHSVVPLALLGAGGALIATGVVYHLTAFRTAATNLDDATDATPDPHLYDQWSHRFDVRRDFVIGFYAAGAIVAGIGAYLHVTEKTERLPQVGVVPVAGGGLVTLGW